MPCDWLTFAALFATSMFHRLSRVQKEEEEVQRKQLEVMLKREQKQQELFRQKAREVSQLQVGSSSSSSSSLSPSLCDLNPSTHTSLAFFFFANRRTSRTLSPWRIWISASRKHWIIPRITTLPLTKREEWWDGQSCSEEATELKPLFSSYLICFFNKSIYAHVTSDWTCFIIYLKALIAVVS